MNNRENKKKLILTAALCVVGTCVVISVLGFIFLGLFTPRFHQTLRYSEFLRYIDRKYIGEYDLEDITSAAMNSAVDSLQDRWSHYYTVDENEQYKIKSQNQFQGIGIVLDRTEQDNGIQIVRVYEDSPAERAGLLPGDVIVAADNQSLVGISLDDAIIMMSKEKGQTIDLTIQRDGETLVCSPVFDEFYTNPISYQLLENNIGLITIRNFQTNCFREFVSAYEDLLDQGAGSFILDVRNNGGGYVSQLTSILDYLLPEGDVFYSTERGKEPVIVTSDASCKDYPTVVLFNARSYSAAEYFGAFLGSDGWGYAQTVGTHTTGKGRYQVNYDLMDEDGLHLSIGEYSMPNGLSLFDVGGVAPDYEVILSDESELLLRGGLLPYEDDLQLQKAVELLTSD